MDTIEMNTPDDIALADRMKVGRDQIITRAQEADRRAGRRHQPGAADAVRRRQQPDHRRARPRQDAADSHHRARARPEVLAHPVHARPDAVRHHRHRHHPGGRGDRPPPDGVFAGADLRQHRAGRRDQPHAAEDAVRAAGSHAGTSRHDPGPHLQARRAVLRVRDAEPDRARRHVSAARSAARSLHVPHRHRASAGRRGVHGREDDDGDPRAGVRAAGQRSGPGGVPAARAPRAGGRSGDALRAVAGAREPSEEPDLSRVDQEVDRVRRQRPRGAVSRARRQGARADQRPLPRELRGHPRGRALGDASPRADQLPRAVGRHHHRPVDRHAARVDAGARSGM